MRFKLMSCLALLGTLAVSQPPAAHASARASVTTPVLPASVHPIMRTFSPDSAAPPESTSWLQFVGLCPTKGCNNPICIGDSIRVTVGGSFPNDCYFVRKIDLYEPPVVPVGPGVVIRPIAPWVRVIVDDGACLGRACIVQRTPWEGSITMPPLPDGPYTLNVAVIGVSCTDTVPPPPWQMHSFPFAVGRCDTFPPPRACLLTSWDHQGSSTGCDLTITATEPARLTLQIGTRTALAGLQGSFQLQPPTLKITNIEPVGPAAGMRITWAQTATGAQYVMFSDQGSVIPPTPADGSHVGVLAVTVSAASATIPPVTELQLGDLLGSDPDGGAVPPCPIIATERLVYVPPPRICSAAGCDFNRDAITDVRDIVLMVRCLYTRALCPNFFDCDGDGRTTIDDVLCCAWKILHVQPCTNPTDCPPDTTPPRSDPAVHVSAGAPVEDGDGIRVPIHIDGADHVGAARLAMSFPADRWSIVSFDSDDPEWLTLAGEDRGQVVMGAIRTSPGPGASGLNLSLRLRPVGGSASGGELGALQVDLSGPDGVKLLAPISGPVRPLPGGPTVELSENRPDPFSGETRFTLSLPVAAAVDLGVFDLGGRRISTLHHGALKAGVSEFAWNGRLDGGGRARGGIYFYRAAVNGQAFTHRMVFLGGR